MKRSFLFLAALIILSPAKPQVGGSEAEASLNTSTLPIAAPVVGTDPASAFIKDVDPALVRSEDGLVIWPIPAQNELNIFCSSETSGNPPFEIVDMTGRTVLRGSIQGEKPNLVEVNSLRPGDHLLRVVDGTGVRSIAFRSGK